MGNNVYAGQYLDKLLAITSNQASMEHRSHLQTLLESLVRFNPNGLIFMDKIDENTVFTDVGKPFGKTAGKTVGNQIFINLNTPATDFDLLETVTHEYVHVSTNDVVQNPDHTDRPIMLDLQNHVREHTKDLTDKPRFLDYFLGSYTAKDGTVRDVATREMFTIGLTNEPVSKILKSIDYQGRTAYDVLYDYFTQAVNAQAQERYNASLRQQSRSDGRSSTDDGRREPVLQSAQSTETTRPRVPQNDGEASQEVSRQPISTITYDQAKELINTLSKQDKDSLRDTVAKHLNTAKPTLKQVAEYVMEFGLPNQNNQSLDEQKQAIKEQYKDNPNYLKAPNGKPTKLSEDEWLLVRTPSFKAWFGDWENSNAVRQRLTEPTSTRADLDNVSRSTLQDSTAMEQGQQGRTIGVSNPRVQELSKEIPINLDPQTLEPRLFYHGTDTIFTKFEIGHVNKKDLGWLGRGAYLTTSEVTAWSYAQQRTKDKDKRQVLSFFIRADNLHEFSHKDKAVLSKANEAKILAVTKQMTDDGLQGSYIKLGGLYGLEVAVFNADNIMDNQGIGLNIQANESQEQSNQNNTYKSLTKPQKQRINDAYGKLGSTAIKYLQTIAGDGYDGTRGSLFDVMVKHNLMTDEAIVGFMSEEEFKAKNPALYSPSAPLYHSLSDSDKQLLRQLMASDKPYMVIEEAIAYLHNHNITTLQQLHEHYQANQTPQQSLHTYLFGLIQKINPTLQIVHKDYGNTGFAGEYVPSQNILYISTSLTGDSYYKYLNHELIHALTETGIAKGGKAVEDLIAIYEQIKTKAKATGLFVHETQDVNEFVSYAFTDKAFMSFVLNNMNLKALGIKPKTGKLSNKLREFVNIVLSVFGLSKSNQNLNTLTALLDEVMNVPYDVNHIGLTNSRKAHTDDVNRMSTTEVFKDLPTHVSDSHNEHLDRLIDNVLGTYQHTNPRIKTDPSKGKLINTSLLNGYQTSDKEAYVTDALITVFDTYLTAHQGTLAVNGLYSLYKDALSQYKTASDLFTDFKEQDKQTKKQMTKMFNFVFNNKSNQQSVARFMAMNLANEQFRSLMSHTTKPNKPDNTWFDKVMAMLEKVVSWFNQTYFKSKSNTHKDLIDGMTQRLVDLDSKARNTSVDLLQMAWETSLMFTGKVFDKPSKQVGKAVIQGIAKVRPNGLVARYVGVQNTLEDLNLAGGKIDTMQAVNRIMANTKDETTFNILKETINEISAYGKRHQWIEQMVRITQSIGRLRQSKKESTIRVLDQLFTDELNQTQKVAITKAVLKTELSALLKHGYELKDITKLLNQSQRDKETDKLAKELIERMGYTKANDMLMQAKSLGFYMATESTVRNLTKSAQGIAIGLGTDYQMSFDKMDKEVYKLIDVLSTLYALDYTQQSHIDTVKELLDSQTQGISAVLQLHKGLVDKSYKEFSHNPLNYEKGYIPQVTNPYRKVIQVEPSEVGKYLKQGFSEVAVLSKDILDNTPNKVMMIHTAYAPSNYVSGALDLSDSHARGSVVYEQGIHDNEIRRVVKESLNHRNQRNKQSYQDYDPMADMGAMIPIYDTDGAILSYHYEMEGTTLDTLLERDNSFDELLGTLQGNLVFKQEIKDHQRHLAGQIFKDAKANYHKSPNEFILLDFDSKDPKVVEMMRLLPYEFRQEIIKHFGDGVVPIHKSIFTATFGFRAYSIANMFDKLHNDQKLNYAEKLLTGLFTLLFKDNARQKAVNFEKMVQDLMALIKDMIVIRSGGVLLGNIISNTLLLSLHGINPVKILKDSIFAWRNAKRYHKTQTQVLDLQTKLLGLTDTKQIGLIQRQLNALNKELSNNPLHEFMKQGLMSTIVEDLDSTTNAKYKTPLQQDMDKYLDKIPKPIRQTMGILSMDKGTHLHSFMAQATQFSDLSAKYVLAKYHMDKGMKSDEAIYESQVNFINYDMPTNQFLDYMNRMGFMMFTKFFLRFQQVMTKLFYKMPITSLSQHGMIEYLGGQGIYEPFIFNRLGNPFDGSISLADNAFGDTLTVEMVRGIF